MYCIIWKWYGEVVKVSGPFSSLEEAELFQKELEEANPEDAHYFGIWPMTK